MNTLPMLFALSLNPGTPWSKLETGNKGKLAAPIQASSHIQFKKGTPLKITAIEGLSGISVIEVRGEFLKCDSSLKTKQTEMVLVQDLYGFTLKKGCEFLMHLETKDFNRESLIEVTALKKK